MPHLNKFNSNKKVKKQEFNIAETSKKAILIVGLGSTGGEFTNLIQKARVHAFDTLLLDSDLSIINNYRSLNKICLGKTLCRGLGTGGSSERGAKAYLEASEEVSKNLSEYKYIIIRAGMRGGLGTGSLPKIVKELNKQNKRFIILTTKPLDIEKNIVLKYNELIKKLDLLSYEIILRDYGKILSENKDKEKTFEEINNNFLELSYDIAKQYPKINISKLVKNNNKIKGKIYSHIIKKEKGV